MIVDISRDISTPPINNPWNHIIIYTSIDLI